ELRACVGGRSIGKLRPAYAPGNSRAGSRYGEAADVKLVVGVQRVEQIVDSLPRELDLDPQLAQGPLPDDGDLFDLLRPLARSLSRCFRGGLRRDAAEGHRGQQEQEERDNGPAAAGAVCCSGNDHGAHRATAMTTRERYLTNRTTFFQSPCPRVKPH